MAAANIPESILLDTIELVKTHGSIAAASRATGILRTTLNNRLKCARERLKAASGFENAAKSSRIYKTKKNPASDLFDSVDNPKSKTHASAPKNIFETAKKSIDFSASRFVITSAQNATPVSPYFFQSLLTYCHHNKAQLIVIPYRYRNPTSIWTKDQESDDWWAPEVRPYLMDSRVSLTQDLVILGDIKTQPTASRPLSGFQTLTGGQSAIIGHPKLELETVPTPQHKLPKILTTTGSCTVQNYGDGKAGKVGAHHHTFGAAVVEINRRSGAFHLRQINATRDGSFYDLTSFYSADGVETGVSVAGLVMGDTHHEVVDPDVVLATFVGKSSICDVLKPKHLVWHDVIDQYARNHHHKNDPFIAYAKHKSGVKNNVEADLKKAFEFIDAVTPSSAINIFVPSNHVEALGKWVRECDPKADPENVVFWAKTYVKMLEGTVMTDVGASTPNPFLIWAKEYLQCANQCVFLKRDEPCQIHGIEVGYHGDAGPNGARGSRNAFGKIGVKTIIGHSHSPGIRDGVYQVGTSSRYDLEYASGPSSWLHTHCVIYKNGKRCLINIIGDQWKL